MTLQHHQSVRKNMQDCPPSPSSASCVMIMAQTVCIALCTAHHRRKGLRMHCLIVAQARLS